METTTLQPQCYDPQVPAVPEPGVTALLAVAFAIVIFTGWMTRRRG